MGGREAPVLVYVTAVGDATVIPAVVDGGSDGAAVAGAVVSLRRGA